ncbi:MAG: C25 family cysteine peptidase [Cyclobacteriaceae bacterium]
MNKFQVLRCLVALAMISCTYLAHGQYANSWIDFNKEYYKVTLASDGAFRLTYSDLQNAGFPVGSVDPRRIQLYHRGIEQAIIVQGQADAQFNPSDYIEFYGRKNDGVTDTRLYSAPNLQPHTYYNLYSDTSAYFLTWSQALVQGKRMTNFSEVNVSAIPKDDYHNNERLSVYTNEYSTGNTVSGVLQYTQFDEGEGWTGTTICIGNSGCTGQLDNTISNLTGGVVPGGDPQLELLMVGRDELSHMAEVYVGPNSGSLRLLTTKNFINYQTSKVDLPILWSDVSAGGQLAMRVKALGVGGARDRISVSYIKVTFPQDFNMASQASKVFQLITNPSNKSYIEITNPASGLTLWDITDPANVVTIGTAPAGPNTSAVVPNTNTSRKLFAKNNFSAPNIKKIKFRQVNPSSSNYLIISNKALMKPALGYSDPVKAYGGFRASAEGGGYDTLVVAMDQLYNQFNYGESSSSAIYEFVKFMVENGDPKYLFLIGKGLNVSAGFFRKTVFGPNDLKDLVPSAGMPGSDMAFSAGLDGTLYVPAVPTGRITASTPAQVAAYLNKIKEIEALPFTEQWRKRILHLSGGIQPLELTTFKQYMETFAEVAEGPYYGGDVATISKQEPNPVELINVSEEVNEGVNFITFFGHSSPSTIDIDIGFASDPVLGYNNPEKYPGFLINGCNAGVFFSNGTVFGEDWILAANKGARNFIAHSSFGFVGTLRTYTQLFYETGFGDSTFVRTGIGDIQKEVGRKYLEIISPSISAITQVQQMMLLGDPAVKLFGALAPDYETNDNAIYVESFDGGPVTALSDSFAIKVIANNFGSVSKASMPVRVTRTFSDNSSFAYDSVFTSPSALDTLTFIIRREEGVSGFGSNEFLVELDFGNKIDELDEDNNNGKLSLFIPLSGTRNLIPSPFGIVNETNVTLKWQNTDLLSDERSYDLEVDSVDTFDSPFLQQFTLTGKVLNQQEISLAADDSTAYYWRTKLTDPLPGENQEWSTTSFTHISNGDEGWAQVHFPQLNDNPVAGLIKDPIARQLKFEETQASIFVDNFGSSHPSPSTTSFKVNNVEYNLSTQGQPCRNNTINFVAFDKTTLVPYAGIPFIFQDPRTCGREPQVINSFRLTEMETGLNDDVIKVIDNINLSDSVVIFSIGNANYPSWTSNVVTKMAELGISAGQLSGLVAGEPVVIFGKKGAAPGAAIIKQATATPHAEQELQVSEVLTGKYTSGKMTSQLVGPAFEWNKFVAYTRLVSGSDDYSFDLIGLKLNGEEQTLLSGVTGETDLSLIDAAEFPFIRIELNTEDEIEQSSVQLHQWLVNYTPVAEGVLLFDGPKEPVEVAEGENWSTAYSFVNISDKLFSDSLRIDFNTFNKTLRTASPQVKRIFAPVPGDTTHFMFTVETREKVGLNDVNVRVNDKVIAEQVYDNNVLELNNYLNVIKDSFSPIADVTFDGRYILDNDFVSANPLIRARIWDDNKFVLKMDTVGLKIFLMKPCLQTSCNFEPIYFSSDEVEWMPATTTEDFTIDFSPSLVEGEYQLRLETQDGSSNQPQTPYQVKFRVSESDAIGFDDPYPNPSSENVFYRFTASGQVAPDSFVLRVYTLDGRLVKEFTQANTGLHIGTNELSWSGDDDAGTPQRAGMYLYRLSVTMSGKAYTRNGKIILLR